MVDNVDSEVGSLELDTSVTGLYTHSHSGHASYARERDSSGSASLTPTTTTSVSIPSNEIQRILPVLRTIVRLLVRGRQLQCNSQHLPHLSTGLRRHRLRTKRSLRSRPQKITQLNTHRHLRTSEAHLSMCCHLYLTNYKARESRRSDGSCLTPGSTCAFLLSEHASDSDPRIQHWREEKGFDLYPVLRLILPQVSHHPSAH